VAQKLSEDLRQQMIADNRGGAAGLIGTETRRATHRKSSLRS
jgi:tripartite-type tricarboxylate transporter receptor subunit TctC